MFEHVMVALDLTPAADAILRRLGPLRELGAQRVTLVHVAEVDYPIFGAIANLDHHRRRLEEMADVPRSEGFDVEVVATAGLPAAEILKAARERRASLVVVGSRSRSPVREAFVGSVAWEVVGRGHIPVLLERVERAEGEGDPPRVAAYPGLGARVLLPTDFSSVAEVAFEQVEEMAYRGARSFTLLHALAPDGDAPATARARLEALADRLRAAGADEVEIEVRTGDPAREALRLAGSHRDVLLVIGTRGRGALGGTVLGSVSREVVRGARCAVLLVPPRG